jgi:hypothetical protein
MVVANAPRGSVRMTGMIAVLARQMLKYAPAELFPVRLEPELRRARDGRAAVDDTTASDIEREALRRYLKVTLSNTRCGSSARNAATTYVVCRSSDTRVRS